MKKYNIKLYNTENEKKVLLRIYRTLNNKLKVLFKFIKIFYEILT